MWRNRQRLKNGLPVLSPGEFEEFLVKEMSQDFSNLGIEIEDFLNDLIKIRREEELSFAIFNTYINRSSSQLQQISMKSNT